MAKDTGLESNHLLSNLGFDIHVSVRRSIFSRISQSIAGSDVEVGGKLVGFIIKRGSKNNGNSIEIMIDTYIDSGPRVDASSVHLFPDGEYQEKIFRLLEQWEPDIEHIGTWHSHHPNGCPSLSGGDIDGYFQTVNDPNYNLDLFIGYLIHQRTNTMLNGDFYLFIRGEPRYFRLNEECIHYLEGESKFEPILKQAEQTSRFFQNRLVRSQRSASNEKPCITRSNKILLEDKEWFSTHFPKANLFRSQQDGKLVWQWTEYVDGKAFPIKYRYDWPDIVSLEIISSPNTSYTRERISLDDLRHSKVESQIQFIIANNHFNDSKNISTILRNGTSIATPERVSSIDLKVEANVSHDD